MLHIKNKTKSKKAKIQSSNNLVSKILKPKIHKSKSKLNPKLTIQSKPNIIIMNSMMKSIWIGLKITKPINNISDWLLSKYINLKIMNTPSILYNYYFFFLINNYDSQILILPIPYYLHKISILKN